ncbi:MAG: hypothetical protein IPI50_04175 [Saprospiraceae bacterium]|nr:hypothetical protein [Saprospiraceae bacterium]
MNFDRKDQSMDQFFREKLENLDFGPQEHLWAGIEKSLDENSSRKKLFGLPWISNLIIGLSLVSFSLMASYKYGYYVAEKKTEEKAKQKLKNIPYENKTANIEGDNNMISKALEQEILVPEVQEANKTNSFSQKSDYTTKSKVKNIIATKKDLEKFTLATTEVDNNNILAKKNGFEEQNKGVTFDNSEEIINKEKEVQNIKTSSDQWASTKQRDEISMVDPLQNRPWLVSNTKRKRSTLKHHIKEDPCNLVERHVKRDRIYLDFYFAPEISKRTIVPVYPNSKDYADRRNADEKFVRSHSMGVRGSYVLKNGLAFRTGFNYSEIKERFNFVTETQLIQIIRKDDKGNPIDTVHQQVDIVENIYNYYKFYDLPFVLGYEIDLADFVFSINGGVAVNLMTRRTGFVYEPNSKEKFSLTEGSLEGKQFFKNNVGMSLVGSFGLNYKMSRGLMLLAEPSVRYYLGSITTDNYPLKQNYIQFGLIAGLRYQFIR